MTYEDSVKHFFGGMNDDFYYSVTDNIFELTYEEAIKYAKENNFYETTINNRINKERYRSKKDNYFAVAPLMEILKKPVYIGKVRYNVRIDWRKKKEEYKS